MPRSKNTIKSVQLDVKISNECSENLKRITDTGHYGKNPADTANQLIIKYLREHLDKGQNSTHDAEARKISKDGVHSVIAVSITERVLDLLNDIVRSGEFGVEVNKAGKAAAVIVEHAVREQAENVHLYTDKLGLPGKK